MAPAEHYAEAERLIEEANHVGHSDRKRAEGMIVVAQVHAILSLVPEREFLTREWIEGE